MTNARSTSPALKDIKAELVAFIAGFSSDPYGFALAAFPWGEPGTPLEHMTLDPWQADILCAIRDGLITAQEAIRIAVASGHGIGKSALVAIVILWALATHEDTRGVVTAGTEGQLRTKTVPELGKWFRMMICRHWFVQTATSIFSADPRHKDTWRIDFIPWNETNPEAFAGLHNQGKRILVVFDEASQIADIIWETIEGALTDADTEILWLCFGNYTRNTGKFHECFGRYRHRWTRRQIDSRTVKITNKTQIEQWIADYGEDSDFVRVRVRGVAPRAGALQYIPGDTVEAAAKRQAQIAADEPVVMGVDVARFGDDQSVIAVRRGRDAKFMAWGKFRGLDTMQLAARVLEWRQKTGAAVIFVDGGGVGAGVVDRLIQLGAPVIEVQFGARPDGGWVLQSPVKVRNKRTEMWAVMREWLKGGAIPDDPELIADLTGVEYGYDADNAEQLEKKSDMKKRGLASPDMGDALALTFAQPVHAQGGIYDRDSDYRPDGRSSITGY